MVKLSLMYSKELAEIKEKLEVSSELLDRVAMDLEVFEGIFGSSYGTTLHEEEFASAFFDVEKNVKDLGDRLHECTTLVGSILLDSEADELLWVKDGAVVLRPVLATLLLSEKIIVKAVEQLEDLEGSSETACLGARLALHRDAEDVLSLQSRRLTVLKEIVAELAEQLNVAVNL